jgi:hypothetical protein
MPKWYGLQGLIIIIQIVHPDAWAAGGWGLGASGVTQRRGSAVHWQSNVGGAIYTTIAREP